MPLEAIGAGFGRTGTLSLQKALDILYQPEGRQCYHFTKILTRPDHAAIWLSLLKGDVDPATMDWGILFDPDNFAATQDHPCANYYEHLMKAYPDAKVILSRHPRGREAWYESKIGHQQLAKSLQRWPLKPMAAVFGKVLILLIAPPERKTELFLEMFLKPFNSSNLRTLVKALELNMWGEGGVENRDHALSIYDEWYARVPQVVPKEKLLEYDVSMGWEPLCRFLNKTVPDVPFPRMASHSKASIRNSVLALEIVVWCFYGLTIVGVLRRLFMLGCKKVEPRRKVE